VSKSGVIGRVRGRPFAKGHSGNPGGRPIKPMAIELRKLEHDVRLSSRDWGFEAVEKLVVLMRGVITVEIDKKRVEMLVPPMTQLAAANALLDRGYGRPGQSVELHGGEVRAEEQEGSALEFIETQLNAMRERHLAEGHPLLIQP
jgi:hypothetical protein